MKTAPVMLYESGIPKLAKSDRKGKTRTPENAAARAQARGGGADADRGARRPRAHPHHLDPLWRDHFKLRLLVNRLRLQTQTPHPTDPEIVEAMFGDVIDLEVLKAHLEPLSERFPLRDIAEGHCACVECGATNGNGLESHHTVPRSVKGKDEHGPYDGTTSSRVWLWREHHAVVTENIDGIWREWVEKWLAREDMGWYRAAMAEWLGPRKLEEIGR